MKAPRGSQRLPHADQAARLDSWNYLLARCQELGVDVESLPGKHFIRQKRKAPLHGMTRSDIDAALVRALSDTEGREQERTPRPDAGSVEPDLTVLERWEEQVSTSECELTDNLEAAERQVRNAARVLQEAILTRCDCKARLAYRNNNRAQSQLRAGLLSTGGHAFWHFEGAVHSSDGGYGAVWSTRRDLVLSDVDGTPYNLGEWWLLWQPGESDIVVGSTNNRRHPHVSPEGDLCFGDWVQAASRALAQAAGMDSDLGAALEALLSAAARALSSYNSSSCYLPIAEAHSAREALDHDCALAVHRLLRSQAAKSKAAAEAKQTARKKR